MEDEAMNRTMKRNLINVTALRGSFFAAAVATVFAISVGSPAHGADAPAKKPATTKTKAKAATQKAYASPEELFQALADAAKADDAKALGALLGPGGDALIDSGDAVADRQVRAKFAASYAEKHSVTKEGEAKATLIVGNDDWPMAIPATKGAKGWTLDTAAGRREILARRIGRNELSAIQVVRAIGDAERDYSGEDRDVNGRPNYARKFGSSPGKKDGLYWPTKEGEPQSPLGPLAAQASSEGYAGKKGGPTPYHGYYYRILTAQGKDAKGGAQNYIVQGMMIGGFAVVAYPAAYANSGVMTFIAGADGVVYEKDLGDKTTAIARGMKTYNPDATWKPVK
jgi:hypothetical protein